MEAVRMPRNVDEPLPVLFFEVDEVIVFTVCLLFGIVTRELTYSAIAGIFVIRAFSRWKNGKLPGVLAHMAFWYGLFSLNKVFVASKGREFIE
jgi:conjugal transfer pilus assembly protein TraL